MNVIMGDMSLSAPWLYKRNWANEDRGLLGWVIYDEKVVG